MRDESLPERDAAGGNASPESDTAQFGSGLAPERTAEFRALLTPYRSLGPTGFLLLMGGIGLVSFVMGVGFLLIGAWPVLGFFGLDVVLIYVAFKLNYRAGCAYETIEIDGRRLTLLRVDAKGRRQSFEFNPYWVDVRLRRGVDGRTAIALASHGRELAFGHCLTDDERAEFATALRGALQEARRAKGASGDQP